MKEREEEGSENDLKLEKNKTKNASFQHMFVCEKVQNNVFVIVTILVQVLVNFCLA